MELRLSVNFSRLQGDLENTSRLLILYKSEITGTSLYDDRLSMISENGTPLNMTENKANNDSLISK